MNPHQAITIYSRLFDHQYKKDIGFYRSLYVTPLHQQALTSILETNSETLGSSAQLSSQNIIVLQDLLYYGLQFLVDAMDCPITSHGLDESSVGKDFQLEPTALDDLTNSLNGLGKKMTSPLVDLDEDGDITHLNGQTPNARRSSQVSVTSGSIENYQEEAPTASNSLLHNGQVNQFKDIDDVLRVELVTNILKILSIWFDNVYVTNQNINKAKTTIGLSNSIDICVSIFEFVRLEKTVFFCNQSILTQLLYCIKWYIAKKSNDIDSAYENCIHLLYSMVKTFFRSLIGNHDREIIQSLFSLFYHTDCTQELDQLLMGGISNQLSYNVIMEIITIDAVLSKVPRGLLSKLAISSDISTFNGSSNVYETFFNSKKFNQESFKQLSNILVPFLALDYNYYYNFSSDLLVGELSKTSFLGWVTGNRMGSTSGYMKYDINYITSFRNKIQFEPTKFIENLQKYYDLRLKNLINSNFKNDINHDFPETCDFLQISLFIYSLSTNREFLALFTDKLYKDDEVDYHIEVMDIWLSIMSYAAYYRTISMKSAFRVGCLLLLKLTSKNIVINGTRLSERLYNYQVNEFKWKLCHHRQPIVPISSTEGEKSSLFYILDVLQVYLRFNLTKRLDVNLITLVNNIIFQVIDELRLSNCQNDYNWKDFFKTINQVLKFIVRKLVNGKNDNITKVLQQFLVIFDFLLKQDFLSVKYDLIYDILLHKEILNEILNEFDIQPQLVPALIFCIKFLEGELESLPKSTELEYGTPEFTQIVAKFELNEEFDPNAIDYANIFKYIHKELNTQEFPASIIQSMDVATNTNW